MTEGTGRCGDSSRSRGLLRSALTTARRSRMELAEVGGVARRTGYTGRRRASSSCAPPREVVLGVVAPAASARTRSGSSPPGTTSRPRPTRSPPGWACAPHNHGRRRAPPCEGAGPERRLVALTMEEKAVPPARPGTHSPSSTSASGRSPLCRRRRRARVETRQATPCPRKKPEGYLASHGGERE